mgnify:CR=1 FL=1
MVAGLLRLHRPAAFRAFAAAAPGLTVQTRENIRRGAEVEGVDRNTLAGIFETAEGRSGIGVAANNVDRIVYRVTSVETPAGATTEPQQIAELNVGVQDDFLVQYVMQLQSRFGVTVNQEALQTVTGGSVIEADLVVDAVVDPDDLRRYPANAPEPYYAVLLTHNETSTGYTHPLQQIGQLCKAHDVLLVAGSGDPAADATSLLAPFLGEHRMVPGLGQFLLALLARGDAVCWHGDRTAVIRDAGGGGAGPTAA